VGSKIIWRPQTPADQRKCPSDSQPGRLTAGRSAD
jgi:hypothetical protein